MRLLVVEDDAIVREAVATTLRQAGYDVTTAVDGLDALEILKAGNHQIVVSDWSMPRMDGIALCRAIRSATLSRYVYFIMLTGHERIEDTLAGLHAGADDYVTKPFNPGELVMRVNTGRRIIGIETRDMAIFAMAKLAESRDPETGAHLERVRSYSRVLTEQLKHQSPHATQIDDEYVRLIYETSPLHDIGKIAIPDCILLSPGRLNDSEFEVMKSHTLCGAETLAAAIAQFPNAPFLKMAHDIALTHHERYDGSGYPHGLEGEDIPLCGRIVAVADVYDALTSKRLYKNAISHDIAKSMIQNDSGKHFDPVIVTAFQEVEQDFIDINKQYRNSPTDVETNDSSS
jgi:putative two-component system response regulator